MLYDESSLAVSWDYAPMSRSALASQMALVPPQPGYELSSAAIALHWYRRAHAPMPWWRRLWTWLWGGA